MPNHIRRSAGVAGVFALAVSLLAVGATPALADVPSGNDDYKTTVAEYVAERDHLVATYPDLARVVELPEPSSKGTPIWGLEITRDVDVPDGKPVFVQVGTHHGNEWTSTELTWEFAWDLLTNADSPEYADLLDSTRVVIVPLVNPDGFEAHTRATQTGIDMNRNYGYGWIPSARGSGNGTAAWSEPETRNIQWLMSTRQATVFNTQHTCIQVVLYPPLLKAAGLTQDNDRLHALAAEMAAALGPTYTALPSGWDYETNGEAIDWTYYATRALSVTTETCHPGVNNSRHNYKLEVGDYYPTFKNAVIVALRETANPAQHSRITGVAVPGTTLELSKAFPMYTRPHAQPDGTVAPVSFEQSLTSEMVVTNADGSFTWAVNPSVRPAGAYTAEGVRDVSQLPAEEAFVTDEPWLLTCTTPDGATQTVEVNVDLGQIAEVEMAECAPDPVTAETTARALGGKVYLSVSATNFARVPADIKVTTAYGSKTFTNVAPGTTVAVSVNSRLNAVPAGEATVVSTVEMNGEITVNVAKASYAAYPAD
ncbi:M14 family zinc carboxypeptidase [Microbacterium sp. NPDC055910]|uniref:M14 family zinc carboxypeptidase n=1 Tax=Microbacterium sp. NPDC055910 TaxID=3345659 RepID=UPI0035DBB8AF